jgi:hypothetical protein
MSKILICGRGKSLEKFDHENLTKEYDYVVLINEFNNFVKTDNKFFNFLKNKRIIQFVNIDELGLDKEFIENFNIHSVYSTRLSATISKKWWREPRRAFIPEQYGIKCKHPSDKLEEYMHLVSNSTDVAILFSLLDLNAKLIDIIGVDFYETNYFLKDENPHQDDERTQNLIKEAQKNIMSIFPEVAFSYITYSSFDPQINNCKIINFK